MNSLFKAAGEHWAIVLKIVCGLVAAGMFLARIPSSQDLENINENLVTILTEQRERIDRHDVAIAARLTQEDVERMIQGPLNPWVSASGSVLPALTELREQIRDTRKDVADLWKIQGIRRGAVK